MNGWAIKSCHAFIHKHTNTHQYYYPPIPLVRHGGAGPSCHFRPPRAPHQTPKWRLVGFWCGRVYIINDISTAELATLHFIERRGETAERRTQRGCHFLRRPTEERSQTAPAPQRSLSSLPHPSLREGHRGTTAAGRRKRRGAAPWITFFFPMTNEKGLPLARELSNCFPFIS